MAGPETAPEPSPDHYLVLADTLSQHLANEQQKEYLADVLNWRPPVPYGYADISDLAKQAQGLEASEPGYAWERLPLWLAKVEETYNDVGKTPIVTLDLGSSIPLYAQYLRAYEFVRDGVRARELTRMLFDEKALRSLKKEDEQLVPIAETVARYAPCRALLESAIQEFLYTVTSEDIEHNNSSGHDDLVEKIYQKLRSQRDIYSEERTGTHVEGGRGLRIIKFEDDSDYFQYVSSMLPTKDAFRALGRLAKGGNLLLGEGKELEELEEASRQTLPVGEELADALIKRQSRLLAQALKQDGKRYRPARFLSFDSSDPAQIALSSMINMPESTRSLELFSHAVASLGEQRQHIVGNIFEELPFPDNSLSLITCFDAWPFHFQSDPEMHGPNESFKDVAIDTLLNFYSKLAYGGKLVIFPWAIKRSSYEETLGDTLMFRAVGKEVARRIGHSVTTELFHQDTLAGWMSISDRNTAEGMSSVFDSEDDGYEVLIIKKPSASSARASQNYIGKVAASKAGTRD